jgi:hypothetical protein
MAEPGCLHDAHFQYLEVSRDQTVSGYSTFTTGVSNPTGLIAPTINSKIQIDDGFNSVLVKNTHYLSPANGNNITATLPTQATSNAGDVIIVEYHIAIFDGQIHKYGTSGEFFMSGSSVYKKTGVATPGGVVVANGNTHDFLKLSGGTNSGPGIGSYVVFTFNGSKWRVEARCTSSGSGADANSSVFATS